MCAFRVRARWDSCTAVSLPWPAGGRKKTRCHSGRGTFVDPGLVQKPSPDKRAGARGFAAGARGPWAPGRRASGQVLHRRPRRAVFWRSVPRPRRKRSFKVLPSSSEHPDTVSLKRLEHINLLASLSVQSPPYRLPYQACHRTAAKRFLSKRTTHRAPSKQNPRYGWDQISDKKK